jgi:hypothetical protein
MTTNLLVILVLALIWIGLGNPRRNDPEATP